MGIDYNAVAGYGVKVSDNLTEKAEEILNDKYDGDMEEFMEELEGEISCETIGNHYSGDVVHVLMVSDPMADNRYADFVETINKNGHLLLDTTPKWICEVCVW